jgi:hypothetical protein
MKGILSEFMAAYMMGAAKKSNTADTGMWTEHSLGG